MLFELANASLTRNGRMVLTDVSATLRPGASCLTGPSGSGKSTLLRLLNRLADPDSGSVRYRGVDVRDREVLGLRREVSLVPQLPALAEGTVAANVCLGCRYAGRDEPDVGRTLELAGLDPSFAERDGSRLSVGEKQRVMLARSLALEPEVLLLDEPTAALDEKARIAVERTLLELRHRLDLSIVLVTHDPAQARRLAQWVVRLDRGRVLGQGPAEEQIA